MKIENDKNLFTNKTFYKDIVEQEKQDFLKIIKKLQEESSKRLNVYTIAAKIARGETVSAEELRYIREKAPALLADAQRKNEERIIDGRGEKDALNKEKQTNLQSQAGKESKEDEIVKTDGSIIIGSFDRISIN